MKKLLYLIVLFPILIFGQTPTQFENYIKSTTYKVATPNGINDTNGNPLTNDKKKVNVTYYDGLGRPKQQVASQQSPLGFNIITHIGYDALGRQEKEFLPYKSDNSGLDFETGGESNTLGFYSNLNTPSNIGNLSFELTPNPFSQKIIESSTLNRVFEQAAPGSDWSIGNHTIKFDYQTNIANEVRKYKVDFGQTTETHAPIVDGYYAPNQLYKTVTKDENWTPFDGLAKTTQEFTDKNGKVVLKRTFTAGVSTGTYETFNTYYVYDIYGNLSYVFPPTASDAIDVVFNSTAVSHRNYPWTKMAEVNEELALEYDKIFSEYKNELIANADLLAKYGGQGGFTLSKNSENELVLAIDISTVEAMKLRNGEILSLKELGDFKDTELGRISGEGYEYIFAIKSNMLAIVGSGSISNINVTFNGAVKLVYNKNYPWSSLVDIDPKEAEKYRMEYAELDNASILTAELENPYGAKGGINISIDENDTVSLDLNITSTTALELKKGIAIQLETERRIADTEIGLIESEGIKYWVSIKENSLFFEGSGNFTNINAQRGTTPPVLAPIPQTVIDGLCYIYRYDSRNRVVEKKVPGKGWEYMVYDKLDRLVLTQDANLRLQSRWLYTKYDVFNRVVYTGDFTFFTSASNSALRRQIQTAITNNTSVNESKSASGFQNGGITINYTQSIFPNSTDSDFRVFTVNYYDDYGFQPYGSAISIPPSITFNGSTTVNMASNLKSLPTGSLVRILETNNWIVNTTAYDSRFRPFWSKSENSYLQTTDETASLLDFTGKIIQTVRNHNKSGATSNLGIIDRFTYDNGDRLSKQTQTIGNHNEELIVFNKYDELGTLVQKKVGGSDVNNTYSNTTALQTIDYAYNVRGWLKSVNNPDATLASSTNLFSYKINYNLPLLGATPLYNGNVSETTWRCKFDDQVRNYKYSYDDLNRLVHGEFVGSHYINGYLENYTEGGITYDKNGNIITLSRSGLTTSGIISTIDQLVYSYQPSSNKLKKVTDYGNPAGFTDGVNTSDDYTYDINGNMKTDLNKAITSIDYNHLNLPTRVNFYTTNATGKYIQYFYDATGKKQRKIVQREGINGTTNTDYSQGYVYENNILQFVSQPEGYAGYKLSTNDFSYVYQFKDHLGNVRLSYTKNASGALEVVEDSNYYPFGLKQQGYGIVGSLGNVVAQRYKYQSQERQDELGLNWDSFKWRNYDYTIGRFMSIDPLAEKYPYNSTYAFQENKMGMGRELEGLELGGAEFNKYAVKFGKAVTDFFDSIRATFSGADVIEIIPNAVSVETSSTTTYCSNCTNYAMSSQYPNFGDANLFNKPKTENKTEVKFKAEGAVVVEGVTVTASQTQSKDMKTGKKESESKVVIGAGDSGVYVSKTKADGAKSETRAGVQAEVSLPVAPKRKVKFSASISVGN